MNSELGADEVSLWFFSLYGVTMLSVQSVEYAVSFVYAVVNTDPAKESNASMKRQLKEAVDRMWRAFQQGSAGMKLNDRKIGIKDHISSELYDDLDGFIKGPRNQLAHNFLVERIASIEQEGRQALIRAGAELLPISRRANRLRDQLQARAVEIVEAWPESPGPPEDMVEWVERLTRMTTLKQFPARMVEQTNAIEDQAAES